MRLFVVRPWNQCRGRLLRGPINPRDRKCVAIVFVLADWSRRNVPGNASYLESYGFSSEIFAEEAPISSRKLHLPPGACRLEYSVPTLEWDKLGDYTKGGGFAELPHRVT